MGERDKEFAELLMAMKPKLVAVGHGGRWYLKILPMRLRVLAVQAFGFKLAFRRTEGFGGH